MSRSASFQSAKKYANDDQRRRVQTSLLRDGLTYSPKTKSLNPGNSTVFSVLQEVNPKNLCLASLSRRKFELSAELLRDAELLRVEIEKISPSLSLCKEEGK